MNYEEVKKEVIGFIKKFNIKKHDYFNKDKYSASELISNYEANFFINEVLTLMFKIHGIYNQEHANKILGIKPFYTFEKHKIVSQITILNTFVEKYRRKNNLSYINSKDLILFYYKEFTLRFDTKSISTPNQLRYLNIKNFQCITDLYFVLPAEAPFVAFVGDNGDGKTSILQAIGLGLSSSKSLAEEDLGNPHTFIELGYRQNEEVFINYRCNDKNNPLFYALDIDELNTFSAYGASRLRVNERGTIQEYAPLLNLFNIEKARLFNVFDREMRDLSVNDKDKFEEIRQVILKLLPQVSDIVKEDESKVISNFLFVEKGHKMPFKLLSAAHKSLVLMIGDMIFRLLAAQPEVKKVADLQGIVLIDELEAHLHPRWQQALPGLLHEIFPKVQFIVSTHSPICIASMPPNSVFYKVSRSEEEGTQVQEVELDTQTLLPNQILTSQLYDLDIFKNKDPRFIDTSESAEERAKNKAQTEDLKAWFENLEKQAKDQGYAQD